MRRDRQLKMQPVRIVAIIAALALGAGAAIAQQAEPAVAAPQVEEGPGLQGEQGPGSQGEQGAQQGEQDPAQTPPPPQTPPSSQPMLTPEEQEALALVEQIIRDQEGILMGTAFDYQPGGRRDPFLSLLNVFDMNPLNAGERPAGLPGFLISEIELKAVASAQGRWHAMVTGPDQRAYFLEVGTQVWDGHVINIQPGEVVFQQEVPDMMGARRTREVTKELRTNPGGGRTP